MCHHDATQQHTCAGARPHQAEPSWHTCMVGSWCNTKSRCVQQKGLQKRLQLSKHRASYRAPAVVIAKLGSTLTLCLMLGAQHRHHTRHGIAQHSTAWHGSSAIVCLPVCSTTYPLLLRHSPVCWVPVQASKTYRACRN